MLKCFSIYWAFDIEINRCSQSLEVEDFTSITGKGVQANVQGTHYYVGSPALFNEQLPNGISEEQNSRIVQLQMQGKTVMVFCRHGSHLDCDFKWIAIDENK